MISIKTLQSTTQIKKSKIFIVLDDMITDILSNKKLNPVVTELLFLSHNIILMYQKNLGYILCIILL